MAQMPAHTLALLQRLYDERPESFEYFIEHLAPGERPDFGTITLHFLHGNFTRTTVEKSR